MSKPEAAAAPATKRGLSFAALIAWIVCAAFVALSADLMQPAGPFLVFLAAVFSVVLVVCALLSFLPPIRTLMRAAAVFALASVFIFGVFAALQRFVAPQPRGLERGLLAAIAPGVEDVQRFLLAEAARRENRGVEAAPEAPPPVPLTPAEEAMRSLDAGLATADPAGRVLAARTALEAKEGAVQAAAVERLYRTGEPQLRQLAVAHMLRERAGARLPLLATPTTPEAQAFANALQAGGLRIKAIDLDTGVLQGALCGGGELGGTIGRGGVTLTGACTVGEAVRSVVVLLQPTEDFRLAGEARSDSGETARVELPLA